MNRTPSMFLDEAVALFMATRDPEAPSTLGYRTTFGELQRSFPGATLETFEAAPGTALIRNFLDAKPRAAETYRAKLWMLRTFFEWHRAAGNIGGNPTRGLTYPHGERRARVLITPQQVDALIRGNPDPHDQVPLRFLLTLGPPAGELQVLRFGAFDRAARTVTFERRGRHTVPLDDDAFWTAVEELTRMRRAAPSDYVLCFDDARRRDTPTPAELAAMEQTGTLTADSYLWKDHEGKWRKSKLIPDRQRSAHGVHNWWYRCVWRAGVAPPKVKSLPMRSARYTFGRRRWAELGDLSELAKHLGGLGSGGSASEVYRNPDALDKSIGRVRRRLRLQTTDHVATAVGIDGARPVARWWKEPVRVFAEYVEDERDLVELSRVSVEMLRKEMATSRQLRDAAETLTRAVTAAELVESAEKESRKDHPLLHGHSIIAIWSALETMVGDVAESWLLWWPPARTCAGTRVSLAPLRGLPPGEWAPGARQALDREYQKLNRKARSPQRLDNYEWLFDAIGLVADARDDDLQMTQNLWEMQQIRNVFAHKRGIADARFVAANKGLPFNVRDEIRIDRDAWADCLVTALLYADVIVRRMKRELGLASVDWLRVAVAAPIRYPR
jgi:hypothetical protein